VNDHPVIQEMQKEEPGWNPFSFVDKCEKLNTTQVRLIQLQEMTLLLNYTIEKYVKNY
jgi:hypothetical protein